MNDDLHGYKAREPFDSEEKEELPIADSVSLSHRLLEQFSLLDLDDDEILVGQEIIGNVDEDGYLRRDLTTIVQDVNLTNSTAITVEKAEQVLRKIQHMDPVGIASRSLQECLLVQLEVAPLDPPLKVLATRLLTEFYDDFTMRHFEELVEEARASPSTTSSR